MSSSTADINIQDLLEKESLLETDIFIVQDSQNTKRVTLRNLILSMIKDDELPTAYRIYSAQKIKGMIDAIDKYCTDNIGAAENNIANLDKFKAAKAELEALKDELVASISEKVSTDKMNEALDAKMSKTYKITSDDMDTSSDNSKIKLVNLAQEVIDAMTGAVAVPTNRAPVGGWVTEDLADSAVTANKLAEKYRYVAHITEGNINEIIKDGVYLLGSEVLNLPKENADDSATRILEVLRVGEENIIQTVYYTDDSDNRPIYKRKGNINRLHVTDFVTVREVTDTFKVSRDMLADDYNTCKPLSSVNIFTIKEEGNYVADDSVTGLPTEGEKYFVEIRRYSDDNFIYHATRMSTTHCDLYECLTYRTSGYILVNTEWFKVNTTKKSKFDGSRIHLFGDGILFGMGSSDITNKSIPALLANTYGFTVVNNTIGDATIGNYNDDILAERSVLKQISVAVLDDADFVVISAGTNDWKSGMATIGNNTSLDTTSFKGALNMAIKNIILAAPKAKILLMTPIFRSRITSGDSKNSDEYTVNDRYLSEYCEAMVEVAKANHIPVVNMDEECMINKYNSTVYLSDGLHLNDAGQELFTAKLVNNLERFY